MKMPFGMIVVAIVIAGAAIGLWSTRARADLLKEGELAPTFSTQMVAGDTIAPVSLSDYRGKKVILYFYPKDDTPGCTKEACSFRDGYTRIQNAGLIVLGCSIDTSDSHRAFIKKYKIPFPLLLDNDKKIATAYGAANGIPILGLNKRITYVIGEDGKIIKVYPNVDPSAHAAQIISDLAIPENPPPAVASPAASPAPAPD